MNSIGAAFKHHIKDNLNAWHAGLILLLMTIAPQHHVIAAEALEPVKVSVVKRALPVYPNYAIKHKIEGTVLINFSIDRDGNASDIEVVASDKDGLFDATAILGVQKWVYTKPARKLKNNYVAIEFITTDNPQVSKFANVEIIQVVGNIQ